MSNTNNGWRTRMRRRAALFLMALFILSAIGIRLAMIKTSMDYIPVTSDESIIVLMAKRISEGELPLVTIAQPYQFPIESYFMAPVVNNVPRNTFGARWLGYLEGVLTFILLITIALHLAPIKHSWAALALILFPSSYLLTIQFGYPLPHNNASVVFSLAAALFALSVPEKVSIKGGILVFITGLFSGVAFSNNMVVAGMILPIAVVAVTRARLKAFFLYLPTLAAGLTLGLVPYLAGYFSMPGAHSAVAGARTVSEAVKWLWSPALTYTLPHGMGINPTVSPDSNQLLGFGEWLVLPMAVFYCFILLSATGLSLWRISSQVARWQWPVLTGYDIFVGTAWLTLLAFLMSTRAHSHSFRYLFPLLFTFPFLLGYLFHTGGNRIRFLLGAVVIFLVSINVLTTMTLISHWKKPEFISGPMNTPCLEPTLNYLRERDIRHCVASHWAAYRVNFLTDEQIICSQPINERFPGWPIPYKEEVDAAERVAYVLTERIRFLKPHIFESHMRDMEVVAHKEILGEFIVYHDFRQSTSSLGENRLDHFMLTATATHEPQDAIRLVDGDAGSRWGNRRSQEVGEWVQIDLAKEVAVTRVVLDYTCYQHDRAKALNILARSKSGWEVVMENVADAPQPFVFENQHPVYGRIIQGYRFPAPYFTDSIRIEITEPNSSRNWNICQVEVFASNTQ
jgi:hypothetical protein